MKEWMPNQQDWTDRGPSKRPPQQSGRVRVISADGTFEGQPALAAGKVRRIVREGYEHPRVLTAAERDLAIRNEQIADQDLQWMEKWYRDGSTVPDADR